MMVDKRTLRTPTDREVRFRVGPFKLYVEQDHSEGNKSLELALVLPRRWALSIMLMCPRRNR